MSDYQLAETSGFHDVEIIPDGEHTVYEVGFFVHLLNPKALRVLAHLTEESQKDRDLRSAFYCKKSVGELLVLAIQVRNSVLAASEYEKANQATANEAEVGQPDGAEMKTRHHLWSHQDPTESTRVCPSCKNPVAPEDAGAKLCRACGKPLLSK